MSADALCQVTGCPYCLSRDRVAAECITKVAQNLVDSQDQWESMTMDQSVGDLKLDFHACRGVSTTLNSQSWFTQAARTRTLGCVERVPGFQGFAKDDPLELHHKLSCSPTMEEYSRLLKQSIGHDGDGFFIGKHEFVRSPSCKTKLNARACEDACCLVHEELSEVQSLLALQQLMRIRMSSVDNAADYDVCDAQENVGVVNDESLFVSGSNSDSDGTDTDGTSEEDTDHDDEPIDVEHIDADADFSDRCTREPNKDDTNAFASERCGLNRDLDAQLRSGYDNFDVDPTENVLDGNEGLPFKMEWSGMEAEAEYDGSSEEDEQDDGDPDSEDCDSTDDLADRSIDDSNGDDDECNRFRGLSNCHVQISSMHVGSLRLQPLTAEVSDVDALLVALLREQCKAYTHAGSVNMSSERILSVASWWRKGNRLSEKPVVEHLCAHCGCWLKSATVAQSSRAIDLNGNAIDPFEDPPFYQDYSAAYRRQMAPVWFDVEGRLLDSSKAPWICCAKTKKKVKWRYCGPCHKKTPLPRVAPVGKFCDQPAILRKVTSPFDQQKLSLANLTGNYTRANPHSSIFAHTAGQYNALHKYPYQYMGQLGLIVSRFRVGEIAAPSNTLKSAYKFMFKECSNVLL